MLFYVLIPPTLVMMDRRICKRQTFLHTRLEKLPDCQVTKSSQNKNIQQIAGRFITSMAVPYVLTNNLLYFGTRNYLLSHFTRPAVGGNNVQ